MPTTQLITQYAYAKRRGCTHRAVQKAIESGRLVKSLHKQGDKLLIDPVAADAEWAKNTDTSKPSNTVAPRKGDAQAVAATPASDAQPSALVARPPSAATAAPGKVAPSATTISDDAEVEARHISESRAVREAYLAELAKLEYLEAAGKLISAEEVRAAAFRASREARNALQTIPDRIAGQLATATDPLECRRILNEELTQVCAALAKSVVQWVPTDA